MRRFIAASAFFGGIGVIALTLFLSGPVAAVFLGASLLALLLAGLLVTVLVPALLSVRAGDPTIDSYRKKSEVSARTAQ